MRRGIAILFVSAALLVGAGVVSHTGTAGISGAATHAQLGIIWGDAK